MKLELGLGHLLLQPWHLQPRPHPEDTQRITELPVKPLPWSIQAITNLHMIFLSIAAATLVLSFRREVKGKKQKEEKEKLAQAILFSTFSPIN